MKAKTSHTHMKGMDKMHNRIIAQIGTLNKSINYWEKLFSGKSDDEKQSIIVDHLEKLCFARTTLQNLLEDSLWND